jgi:hypothetical protein
MKRIIAVAAFAALATLGTVASGDATSVQDPDEVSRDQYRTLYSQCQYADTADARTRCRSDVVANYWIGKASPELDCRTFSSVTVCGDLALSEKELRCVKNSVAGGMTYRRAEVECYAFL